MPTNQKIVLKAIYWEGKEVTVPELVRETGLKINQVYMALYALKQRQYIIIRTEKPHWENGNRVPPKSFITLRNPTLTESSLKKWGLI